MYFAPGSLDGLNADVLHDGRKVARANLEDRRYEQQGRVHEQVFVRLGEVEPGFAQRLPRPFGGEERMGRRVAVRLRLDDGREIEGAEIGHPWTDQLGAPVEAIPFQLLHSDL
jgi:hypothetical protein